MVFCCVDRPHLVIHSSADEHSCCFHFLVIMSNAAVNIHILVLILTVIIFLNIYMQVQSLGHMAIVCLTFKGPLNVLPQRLHNFIFLPTLYKDSSLSTSSPIFVIVCLFDYSCGLSRCEVLTYCSFDLHFPND